MEMSPTTRELLDDAIANYGTPLYVFDLDEAERTILSFCRQAEGVAGVCYAMKANPFLVSRMEGLADRIEVCSAGEYEICRSLEIDPDKLLISGVLKEEADMERILGDCRGEAVYTAESMNQFHCLAKWSEEHKEQLRVYPRLTSGNQFGMDEDAVRALIAGRDDYPFIEIEGIHYFSGTQKKSAEVCGKELAYLDQWIQQLEKDTGFTVKSLEYGPGLTVPYFEGQADERGRDAEALCKAVAGMSWQGRVILEMGRFFAAECGYYLTGVRDTKTNGKENYCIVDGGINQLSYDGQISGMYRPYLHLSPQRNEGEERDWVICGSLCTTNDVLVRKATLQDLKPGDTLVFHRTGAYAMTEGMALFLSHSLPKVATFSERNGWKLVRGDEPTWVWNTEKSC